MIEKHNRKAVEICFMKILCTFVLFFEDIHICFLLAAFLDSIKTANFLTP